MRNPIIYELLVVTAYALLFYGAVLLPGIYILTENMVYALLSGLLILPTFLFIYIRRVKNFAAFMLLHILSCIAIYYILTAVTGSLDINILCASFVVYQAAFSILYHLSDGKIKISAFFAGAAIVMSFVSSYIVYKFTDTMIDVPQSVIIVGIIACCLFYMHIRNIDEVLSASAQNTVAPVDSIIKFNNRVIALIVSVITVIVLLSRFFFVDKLLLFLYSCLDKLIYFIVSLLGNDAAKENIIKTEQQSETLVLPDLPLNLGVSGGSGGVIAGGGSGILNIIMYVLLILIFIGIIAYLAYDMYKKYRDLPLSDSKKTETSDTKTFIVAEDTASFSPVKAFTALFGISYREKARRLFYRKIKMYHEYKNVPFVNSETPGEMSVKVAEYENIDALRKLYNKARYSGLDITKSDFDEAKIPDTKN